MNDSTRTQAHVVAAIGVAIAVLLGSAIEIVWIGDPATTAHGRRYAKAAPLPAELNAHVREQLAKMTSGRGRSVTVAAFDRARPMIHHAVRVFGEHGLPPELIYLAHVESHWRNSAVSSASAAGVWQFVPDTAVRFGLKVENGNDERFDFEKQTYAAAGYLRFLYDYYDGNWPIAIAAYNCGEGRMNRAIAANGGRADFWELVEKKLLPRETREYTPKVLAASLVAANPALLDGDTMVTARAGGRLDGGLGE
jgi:soluble lytic murein transglycosylase-like protein